MGMQTWGQVEYRIQIVELQCSNFGTDFFLQNQNNMANSCGQQIRGTDEADYELENGSKNPLYLKIIS